jgi:hypothetical protein
MAESGIVDILSVTFGSVLNMLIVKKYPQNVQALTMLVEELLWPLFVKNDLESIADLQHALNQVSKKSRTTKLWEDCVIRPVFTILKYTRTE